jgi:hypothetical protein
LRAQQSSSCRAVAQHPACTKAGEITAHPKPTRRAMRGISAGDAVRTRRRGCRTVAAC